jgi:hypothetical protein
MEECDDELKKSGGQIGGMSARDFMKEIPALSDEELTRVEAALRQRRSRDKADARNSAT